MERKLAAIFNAGVKDHSRLMGEDEAATLRGEIMVELAEEETLAGPLTVGAAVQVQADDPRCWLRFRREEITAAELIAAVSARYRIPDLTIEEPEIEGIVRRIYEEGL